MLTPRENLLQIIQGGKPEYLMDQRSYLGTAFDPIIADSVGFCNVGETLTNAWGGARSPGLKDSQDLIRQIRLRHA